MKAHRIRSQTGRQAGRHHIYNVQMLTSMFLARDQSESHSSDILIGYPPAIRKMRHIDNMKRSV